MSLSENVNISVKKLLTWQCFFFKFTDPFDIYEVASEGKGLRIWLAPIAIKTELVPIVKKG
jgi:hypothetical protein